jgi:hypothetical protein
MDEIARAAGLAAGAVFLLRAEDDLFCAMVLRSFTRSLDAGTTPKAGVHWRGLRLTVPGPQANPSDEVFLHWRPSLHKFHARCHYPKLSWRP